MALEKRQEMNIEEEFNTKQHSFLEHSVVYSSCQQLEYMSMQTLRSTKQVLLALQSFVKLMMHSQPNQRL